MYKLRRGGGNGRRQVMVVGLFFVLGKYLSWGQSKTGLHLGPPQNASYMPRVNNILQTRMVDWLGGRGVGLEAALAEWWN